MNDPSLRLEISRIKNNDDLPVPPLPKPPELSNSATPMRGKLKQIQAYITSLEYNYTGEDFFVKKKDRGFRHVTSTAKLIIREALPIQCVEAVFVGAYLTADMSEVDRFPVCFRSSLDGRVYRHIILAVRSGNVWGALGLSRRETLMYKELKYDLFSKLMGDFRKSYAGNWHRLEHIWVGFPLPHDISSNVPVKWKVMRANVGTEPEWSTAAPNLDSFVALAPTLFERFSITGKIPDHPLLASNSNNDNNNDGPSSPSSNNAGSNNNGDKGASERGEEGGGVGDDPRGSPDARSPSVRSPGFPPYWLGPGSGGGGVGGGRRRASTSVGKPIASKNRKKSSSAGGGSGSGPGKGIGWSRNSTQRSSVDGGPMFVASPPRRPRSKSAGVGGVRTARGRKSPSTSPRRISKSKERNRDRDADNTAVPPDNTSGATDATGTSLAADSPTTCTSTGGGGGGGGGGDGGEKAGEAPCLLSSPPRRLPV